MDGCGGECVDHEWLIRHSSLFRQAIDATHWQSPNGRALAEKDVAGNWIDYQAAVQGSLQLVPDGAARAALADDYGRMLADGMLLDDGEPFESIIERCADIETRANRLDADDGIAS